MEKKVLATLNNIPKDKAWKMIKKFQKHYKVKKVPGAKYLTHGVWFPFDKLKAMIKLEEGKDRNGVRIYFATYLEDEPHADRRPNPQEPLLNYKHRNTVVLIATKTEGDLEVDQYKEVTQKMLDDPFNKGELCPEQCSEPFK